MIDIIDYKGYRLCAGPVGKGWRACIYAPGSTSALAESPTNLEKSRKEEIVAEARGSSIRALVRDWCSVLPGARNPYCLDFNAFGGAEDNRHSGKGDGYPRCQNARPRPASTR